MTTKQIYKIIGFNLGLIIFNIVVFSKGFIGLSFDLSKIISSSLFVTIIVMDILLFSYINYLLIFTKQPIVYKKDKLVNPKDFTEALENCERKTTFKEDIQTTLQQIKRITYKHETLQEILNNYFNPGEMAYAKFNNTIHTTNCLFFDNVNKMLNRMMIFNQDEYNEYIDNIDQQDEERTKIYNDTIAYIDSIVRLNEKILTKLDNLTLEISKLDEINTLDINELEAIQELNDLISQTKFYKD